MKTLKSTKHKLDIAAINSGKVAVYDKFITEYRRVTALIVDDIWTNGYNYSYKGTTRVFDPKNGQLFMPKYIDYNQFQLNTTLTARSLSSMVTQISSIFRGLVAKQNKRLYMLEQLKAAKLPHHRLVRHIKFNNIVKPDVTAINPELSSKCVELIEIPQDGKFYHFDFYLKLYSALEDQPAVLIPIKSHKHAAKYMINMQSMLKGSVLLQDRNICIRHEVDVPELKQQGRTVGADQGMKTVMTFSDHQTTDQHIDNHGHTLSSILDKMTRQKPGSSAFARTQSHRKNHINWAIKKLDYANIKQINLEEVKKLPTSSAKLGHWTNTEIVSAVMRNAELHGVHVVMQSSTYRSQRCSSCGLVRKSNRKGKMYTCTACGWMCDADANAAANHEISLPDVPYSLRALNLNRKGFYWKPSGFFDLSGGSLESPLNTTNNQITYSS